MPQNQQPATLAEPELVADPLPNCLNAVQSVLSIIVQPYSTAYRAVFALPHTTQVGIG